MVVISDPAEVLTIIGRCHTDSTRQDPQPTRTHRTTSPPTAHQPERAPCPERRVTPPDQPVPTVWPFEHHDRIVLDRGYATLPRLLTWM